MKKNKLTLKEKILATGKKHKKKATLHSIVAIGVCVILLASARVFASTPPEVEFTIDENDILFSSSMVGDLMLGRHVEEVADQHGFEYIFKYVKPIFEQSDLTTGNYEHPVLSADEEEYDAADKVIHLYSQPEAVQAIEDAHFDVVSLANNHMMDYKEEGLVTTLETFGQSTVDVVGAGLDLDEAIVPYVEEINGLTVGVVGFNDVHYSDLETVSEDDSGVLTTDPDHIALTMRNLYDQYDPDLVIAHFHAGTEYDSAPTSRQKELIRFIADMGADIVVGHHPHVLQSVDTYNDSFIMYSTGNFIFDQGWTRTRDTVVANYQLHHDGYATLELLPFRIFEAQPRPLTGTTGELHKMRIFRQLTKDTMNTESIVENDERLVFEIDHSHVIDRMNRENGQEENVQEAVEQPEEAGSFTE
ncbi:CapA family protein [Bacillus sp. FJAT-44742]|uniref:CapA family protein n=1 Tax=Bacillus sp. FJAT-44742 TaxID=2014005 RepID=UPI000C23D683|nr:CapA family protein [Bacillus sp. FJAT-44742]